MKAVYDNCIPRDEVLSGSLTEDMFAAKLADVQTGKGPDAYRNPQIFFENTYPTGNFKQILKEVYERLQGGQGSSGLRLETSFGGGKTHTLIALLHLSNPENWSASVLQFIDEALKPKIPVHVAALVGDAYGANTIDRTI